MIPRILIRHLAGSKANRIEQFQLDGARELIIGRGPNSNVRFDEGLDDTVSRRHAIIKIARNDRLSFTIADLGSINGVRLNGKPVSGEQHLLPDDIVELSPGGPAFRIAVEPESLCLSDDGATRQISVQRRDRVPPADDPKSPAAKGSEQPKPRLRYARLAVLTVLIATGLGAGALSYRRYRDLFITPPPASGTTDRQATAAPPPAPAAPTTAMAAAPGPSSPPPSAPVATATTPSASVVYLEARWRLYDKFTGKPVFQKTVTRKGQRLPCFVELDDDRIVPWLTTEDEEHTNNPIGGIVRGTGFIVSGAGSIVTDRHIAAGWTAQYHSDATPERQGLLFRIESEPVGQPPIATIDLTSPRDAARLIDWIPGQGGFLFRSRYPTQLGASRNDLEGRNEILNVLLPSSHGATPAHLIRAATNADLAEIKIEVDRPLPVIELASGADARPQVGQRITTLGFAESLNTSLDQAAAVDTTEVAGPGGSTPNLPGTTSAEGTIIRVDRTAPTAGADGSAANGPPDDIYQLAVKPDHPADGGPVFDEAGRVVGVLASDTIGQTTHVYAYSVGFVRALLQSP